MLILKGKAQKNTYILYLLTLLLIFSVLLGISIILFPFPFSFNEIWISELGDPTKNRIGCVFFDIGFIFTSLGLFPVFLNIYYRIKPIDPILRKIILGFWLVGTITFGSIGIFHDQMQPIHDIFAGISYSSLSLGFIILLILHIVYVHSTKPHSRFIFLLYLSIGQLALFWVLLFLFPVRNNVPFKDFAAWEWVGTISIILTIISCVIILPEQQ
ncbi:MAG: hypothetical protein JW776_12625 [Candidatus Lokiarchaeota archaeon]|nr:hypothetical protein [Candidatus Lokiarchaeota archaeon]